MKRHLTPARLLWLILCCGLVVRVAFFLQLRSTDLAQVPLLDSQTYHDWAARLVAGDWGWNETYWMGPLYPHLLALIYAVFGVGSQVALVFQLGLSLLNVWLVHRLAIRLTGRTDIALLAAFLFSLYGAPVFYAGQLLMATVVTTLYLLVGLALVAADRDPRPVRWFQLGLLIGLAGLARGNVLLLAAAIPMWIWWKRAVSSRDRLKSLLALVVAVVLMLVPVTVRNLVVARDFVLLTSNGGVNLLIGQQADYKGIFAPVMDEPQAEFDPSMDTTLERELGRDLKGSEVSRILTRRALETFRQDLGRMPLHYLRKAYRFWNGYELPQIVSYDYWRTRFPALRPLVLPFTFLSALGLLGLRFLPGRERWLMGLLLGAYFISLLPFFPTSRYRQPVAPLLAVTSAVFLVQLIRLKGRSLIFWVAAALLASAALWPSWASLDRAEVLWQVHLHEASRASKLGDLKTTLSKGRQAEKVRPGLADTPFHLSLYLEDLGARAEALSALQLAAGRAPANRLIPYRQGRNHEELGQLAQAEAAYLKAAELDSSWAYPWLRLGLVYRQMGRLDQALAAMEEANRRGPGHHRLRANLASLYAEVGQNDRARAMLHQLTRDYPLYVNGWFNLALVELRTGRIAEAAAALDRAESLRGLEPGQREQIDRLRAAISGSTRGPNPAEDS